MNRARPRLPSGHGQSAEALGLPGGITYEAGRTGGQWPTGMSPHTEAKAGTGACRRTARSRFVNRKDPPGGGIVKTGSGARPPSVCGACWRPALPVWPACWHGRKSAAMPRPPANKPAPGTACALTTQSPRGPVSTGPAGLSLPHASAGQEPPALPGWGKNFRAQPRQSGGWRQAAGNEQFPPEQRLAVCGLRCGRCGEMNAARFEAHAGSRRAQGRRLWRSAGLLARAGHNVAHAVQHKARR